MISCVSLAVPYRLMGQVLKAGNNFILSHSQPSLDLELFVSWHSLTSKI